jgi:hypothetical protein
MRWVWLSRSSLVTRSALPGARSGDGRGPGSLWSGPAAGRLTRGLRPLSPVAGRPFRRRAMRRK